MIKIAINGFGRIGKTFLRTIISDTIADQKINLVAINIGPADLEHAAFLFKHDSVMGELKEKVVMHGDFLIVGDRKIKVFTEKDPAALPWGDLGIDWVVECSGFFTERKNAEKHIQAGAKRVLISAPAKDEDVAIVLGVNESAYDSKKHKIVSMGSCTTNALMPTVKVLSQFCKIQCGFMTTVHAYTNTQVLIDKENDDLRRARAAAINLIPTTTGATKMVPKIMPELGDVLQGCALRVPVVDSSLIDLVVYTDQQFSVDAINKKFEEAAHSNALKGILGVSREPLVSSDYIGNSHSVVIDALLTQTQGNMIKLVGWYDNEWGYSCRLRDFLVKIG
ncbi:MAG: Glyceraldehyde-3-phosphate dehydrogenase [candidate division TM6 bacterium GW2011_GWF2_32_72]|nr:MAG: Glyceraldehyde-3-phosphate dehydrogenase [candidate division TM6 bacterium GW2011_GWF2_32_72]